LTGSNLLAACLPCPTNTFSTVLGATSSSVCKSCPPGCSSCDQDGGCLNCTSPLTYNNVTLDCSCPGGQYLDQSLTCSTCPAVCASCSSPSVCLSCPANHNYAVGGLCTPCPQYYSSAGGTSNCVCTDPFNAPVDHPCRPKANLPCTEINSAFECIACISPFKLENKKCILPPAS